MAWTGQNPPATDVLLHLNVPCSGGGSPARLEIDKLADGRYRATVGTLLEHREMVRTSDLEALFRDTYRVGGRSFRDVLEALQAMRGLNGAG